MSAADRIADTILRMGQIRAEGLQRSADAQARAQAQSGQIWGGALAQLGQLPGEIAKYKLADTENNIRQAQLAEHQKQTDDRFNANEIFQFTTRPDPDGTVKLDDTKFTAMMQKAQGANIDFDTQSRMANTFKQMNADGETFRQQQLAHQVKVAQNVLGLVKPGEKLEPGVALAVLKLGQVNGWATAQDTEQFLAGVNAGHDPAELFNAVIKYGTQPPDPLQAAKLRTETLQGNKLEAEIPGAAAKSQQEQAVASSMVGGRTAAQRADDERQAAGLAKEQAAQAETVRHNQALEAAQKLQYGREAAVNAETARHNKVMEGQNNPLATIAPNAGANIPDVALGQKNDAFLKTLPPPIADKVKAVVEGRIALPVRMAKGDTYWQGVLDAAVKYDPSFDAANYNARSKARADLTSPSGTGGKTINAMNTALQHAGRLSDLIEKLDNYDTPLANAVVNPLRSARGSTAVTNFNAVAPQLMKEIERAWRGSGGSAGEIQELIKSIGPNMGKQQQRESLAQFVDLLKGKLDSTTQQRDAIMGPAAASIPVLFENNQGVMDKILNRAGSSAAGPVTVNGVTFPNQAAADKAVAEYNRRKAGR